MSKRDKRIWLTLASPNGFAYTHDKCNPSTGAASHHAGLQLAQCDSTDKDECSSPVVFFLVFKKCRWVWSPAISKHRREKQCVLYLWKTRRIVDCHLCWKKSESSFFTSKFAWAIWELVQHEEVGCGGASTWRPTIQIKVSSWVCYFVSKKGGTMFPSGVVLQTLSGDQPLELVSGALENLFSLSKDHNCWFQHCMKPHQLVVQPTEVAAWARRDAQATRRTPR